MTLIGAVAVAWPFGAHAQRAIIPVIGYLSSSSRDVHAPWTAAYRQGLTETGYVEGQNVALEYRWAEDALDRLPAFADDLVRRQVAVIFASGGPAPALAAKAATATIPIVFEFGADPVKLGLVASFNRPAGNITGLTNMSASLAAKRLELLHELVPDAAVIALLVNQTSPMAEPTTAEVQTAAHALGLQIQVIGASTERELDTAFVILAERRAGALIVAADPFFDKQRDQLLALEARRALPAIHQWRHFPAAGGLISYGPSLANTFRRAGIYTGKILEGAKPGDLPVEQPTTFELVVNLKTAEALGLTIPRSILSPADEVIE